MKATIQKTEMLIKEIGLIPTTGLALGALALAIALISFLFNIQLLNKITELIMGGFQNFRY